MNDRPRSSGFFSELRRRGALRALALYLGGAWVAIEVADTTFPRFGFPDWTVTAVVWATVLAFPLVVVLVWAYELEGGRIRRDRGASRRSTVWLVAGVGALTVMLGLGAWWVWLRSASAPLVPPQDDRVAVLPFRTAGASPDLAYLREGMVDLLAVKLTGEVGPRAVDPRTVMSAWQRVAGSRDVELPRDGAMSVAREVGARRAIIGSVVGSPSVLTISASLVDSGVAGEPTTASVVGAADSLPALVDRLAGMLLSLGSGQDSRELEALGRAPSVALISFLRGEAAYRRGEYEVALEAFRTALDLDSTFAQAAFGIERAAPWAGRVEEQEQGRRVAWAHSDRLSTLDQLHLKGRAGPAYPSRPTVRELLDVREFAVEKMPDRADVWYELGDLYFHWGALIEEPAAFDRALEGFDRALELDPSFAAPIHHSMLIAAVRGDVSRIQALRSRLGGTHATFGRWLESTMTGDSSWLGDFEATMDTLPPDVPIWINDAALAIGLPLEGAEGAVRRLTARPGTPTEKRTWLMSYRDFALNAGRPAAALDALDAYDEIAADPDHAARLTVLDALYAAGDSARAEQAANQLERPGSADEATGLLNRCVAAQWRLWHGGRLESALLPDSVRAAVGDGRSERNSGLRVCAEIVDALSAPPGERPARLDSLETYLLKGPYSGLTNLGDPYYANLALAWLREEAGDYGRALGASRRWPFFHGPLPYIAESLRTEARLSARLGRDNEAIEAYRRYLTLRADPEPAREPAAESARVALERLMDG